MKIIGLIAVFGLIALPAVGKPIDSFQFRGWTGGAYADEVTGAFSHCVTSRHGDW